jgi:hypothetical protein
MSRIAGRLYLPVSTLRCRRLLRPTSFASHMSEPSNTRCTETLFRAGDPKGPRLKGGTVEARLHVSRASSCGLRRDLQADRVVRDCSMLWPDAGHPAQFRERLGLLSIAVSRTACGNPISGIASCERYPSGKCAEAAINPQGACRDLCLACGRLHGSPRRIRGGAASACAAQAATGDARPRTCPPKGRRRARSAPGSAGSRNRARPERAVS